MPGPVSISEDYAPKKNSTTDKRSWDYFCQLQFHHLAGAWCRASFSSSHPQPESVTVTVPSCREVYHIYTATWRNELLFSASLSSAGIVSFLFAINLWYVFTSSASFSSCVNPTEQFLWAVTLTLPACSVARWTLAQPELSLTNQLPPRTWPDLNGASLTIRRTKCMHRRVRNGDS